ncbi:folate-binding protein YgfZ [Sphingomonas sp. ID1715]|uniref:CAF17-like 4Fe-4S cluster assembly/insertion protein YgfZ n=1 Tax=Sphingomonas sp. ID1715 TaxID=1656898 RepID=UPI00148842FD|nr:folate-binding protein YgfZ [Sphingomonas sp. ID1715]NNM76335.1 folate-binding protein YgfZ [Sphingomonas sp. ID1715]
MAGTTLTDRALIRLSGEDVCGFLQGLVTNDVSGALPVWAGLLSPQGKALFDFVLWADGDDILVDCEAEAADALSRRLSMYRLRRAIAIERDAGLAVHWRADGAEGSTDPRLPGLGRRWLAPPAEPAKGWREHRLGMGVTEGRAELGDGANLWLECNAAELNGVSFAKGCYVGQENTARMNWRQKVNRRLFVVQTDRDPGEAAQIWYPDLGLAVARLRVEDAATLAWGQPIMPDWIKEAVA